MYSAASERAESYAKRKKLSIERQIGGGIQGAVFASSSGTAIKALIQGDHYIRERNVYFRLREHNVDELAGFSVPRLVNIHDELLIVEMQIVTPPYVLDFASAYLDEPPPYFDDPAIMQSALARKRELFEDRWPAVSSLLSEFRALGIHLADVKPGNVMFGDENE